jgi:hypothetical protein
MNEPAHLFREFEGHQTRKASASGSGNDCVFTTSPDSAAPNLVFDSKSGAGLAVPRSSLLALARQF